MLKIHTTQKLFEKLPVDSNGFLSDLFDAPETPTKVAALGDWTGHVLTINRRQCLLFVHHQTRFPVFIPMVRKTDMKNVDFLFEDVFINALIKLGLSPKILEVVTDSVRPIQFDAKTDKSVLGTITHLKHVLMQIVHDCSVEEMNGRMISCLLAQIMVNIPHSGNDRIPALEMARILGESEDSIEDIEINLPNSLLADTEFNSGITSNESSESLLIVSECLLRYAKDDGVCDIIELHGFLAGIALCKKVVLPSEWLPALWGGEEFVPKWETPAQAQAFHSSIMTLYNEVIDEINEDIGGFEPMLGQYKEQPGLLRAAPWCYGFLNGFALDTPPDNPSEELKMALEIISLPFNPEFANDFDNNVEVITEHCDQIRMALLAIFLENREPLDIESISYEKPFTSNVVPFQRNPKVGRNELCPCGSGKKYKKCCL